MTRPFTIISLLLLLPASSLAVDGAATKAEPAAARKVEPATAVEASEQEPNAYLKAPLFSDQLAAFPIANVGEEVITGQELIDALAGAHGARTTPATGGKIDYTALLDRIINVRLLVAEAREMGIDELPETKNDFEAVRTEIGRQLLQEKAVQDVKAAPDEVERVYQAMVREWKVSSVLLYARDEASALVAAVKAGKDFDAEVKRLVAEKKAVAGGEPGFLPRDKMQPGVPEALEATKLGGLSAPTKVKEGWAVMKVLDVRYPEDAKTRAEATKYVLSHKRQTALEAYYVGIVRRHATVDQKLLASLDFEAQKPGLQALGKDQRVLAKIKGAKPLTVADLTKELTGGFFHGADNAVASKKANREKNTRFDGLLSSRVVPLEVERTGIPESAEFKRKVTAQERQILFNRFLEKAIVPELKYSEAQVQAYYDEHKKEFSTPGFFRLQALAFAEARQAQAAADKLRAGTDFKWLVANAEGQLPAGKAGVQLDGGLYIASALPRSLVASLGGATKGDVRLYTDEAGVGYAVQVLEVVQPSPRPYEEVRQEIGGRLFADALVKSIEAWAGKLRPVRGVKVNITKIGD